MAKQCDLALAMWIFPASSLNVAVHTEPRELGLWMCSQASFGTKHTTVTHSASNLHLVITRQVQQPSLSAYQRAAQGAQDQAGALVLRYLAGVILKHLHSTAERTVVF